MVTIADPHDTWLVASNGRTFDSDGAFSARDEIDWSETASAKIEAGDTVLLYGTRPISALTHQCRVLETGIPFDRVIDDREYWVDQQAFVTRRTRSWMRLRLEHTFDSVERQGLSLSALLEHGLKAAPQGRMHAPIEIQRLVERTLSARPIPDDATAELLPIDAGEADGFRAAIAAGQYAVDDRTATTKTRGSAQRAFAEVVKRNYGHRCAVTGITTRDFLVASHIVPWAADASIRLDPSNGICLSTLVDRAYDTGYLSIDEDRRVIIHADRLGRDEALLAYLLPFDGMTLASPSVAEPSADYLAARLRLPM
jgi:hypothetical protein